MAKIEYELKNMVPKVGADYSGNLLDPLDVTINKALGSFGAIPPYFMPPRGAIITQVEEVGDVMEAFSAYGTIHSQMPLRVCKEGESEWFTFPFEPLVSISGKNNIIRRSVAKSSEKGTIKERWSQDDYTVTIRGVVKISDESKYPAALVRRLVEYFDQRQAIHVEQAILQIFGIHYLAIESAEWPHTKGLNNQNFEIKAYSDNTPLLLITT